MGDILHDILVKNDSASRKLAPVDQGFMEYFPRAMSAVACMSRMASEKHNGKGKFGWSWDRSDDHGDCILRHQADKWDLDEFGLPHAVAVAWRAMAQLQIELETQETRASVGFSKHSPARGLIGGEGT